MNFFTVSSLGDVINTQVKTFLKRDPDVITQYQSITTLCNKSLSLSGDHLVYARKFYSNEFNPG